MPTDTPLYKSTSIVSTMTFFSRTLGFVRDMLLASLFGATAGFDAFLVAFKVPNFMRGLFAEGSFSQAFVPILAEYQQVKSPEETLAFIARTASWLGIVLLLITLSCELIAPFIVYIFAPGFMHDTERYQMALHMLYITFPYLLLIALTAFYGAVLNSYRYFAAPAFAPILLNIVLIVAAKYFSPFFTLHEIALAWGVLVAGLLQFLFLTFFLWQKKLLVKPKWQKNDAGVKRIARTLLPALVGVSVMQIGLLINTLFASFLQKGSISWLYYADRLAFFPLGIFGVALATVVLPHLSSLHAKNQNQQYSITLDWALRMLLIVSVPAMLGLMLLSGPIVATLFMHGNFTVWDVLMTQQAVIAFSIGLPAFMAVKILIAACYAKHDVKRPVQIALIALILNVLIDAVLIFPLAHVGVALGTGISALINGLLLLLRLKKSDFYRANIGWKKFFLQLLIANGMMSCLLLFGLPKMKIWLFWRWHQQFSHLFFWLFVAITTYVIGLWITGFRFKDLRELTRLSISSNEIAV